MGTCLKSTAKNATSRWFGRCTAARFRPRPNTRLTRSRQKWLGRRWSDRQAAAMPANDGTGIVADRAQRGDERAAAISAERGLDWFNLFVANIQTGFGPFVAVYLTTQGWTQTRIGLALSLGTIAAMASQVPAGALVDAVRSKAAVAFFSILAFAASALLFALWPVPLSVYLAEVLHGFSSCTLGPAIAAIILIIAAQRGFGLRLGPLARFAALGNRLGPALTWVLRLLP